MTHAEKRPAHMENELANLKAMAESGEELWLGHTAALLLYNYITHLKAALAEERKRCEELENACEEYEMEAKAQEDGRLHGKILCLEAEIERDRAEIARLREENRVLQESVMATDSEMFRLRARIANPGQTQYCLICEERAREVEEWKGIAGEMERQRHHWQERCEEAEAGEKKQYGMAQYWENRAKKAEGELRRAEKAEAEVRRLKALLHEHFDDGFTHGWLACHDGTKKVGIGQASIDAWTEYEARKSRERAASEKTEEAERK